MPPAPTSPTGPRGIAYRYGWIHREGGADEQVRAILVVDCSRYDGKAIREATAKRGISPKSFRRAQAAKAAAGSLAA